MTAAGQSFHGTVESFTAADAMRCSALRSACQRPGVNLDKALQLAGELEDTETLRKLQLRK